MIFVYHIKRMPKMQKERYALKLDMAKAYNEIEHPICLMFFLNLVLMKNKTTEIKIMNARNSPRDTHLLYAYDMVFFAKTDLRQVHYLKEILGKYVEDSSQKVTLRSQDFSLITILIINFKEVLYIAFLLGG